MTELPNLRLEKAASRFSRLSLGVNRKEGMKMTRVRVEGFTISLDGYGAGPNQDIRNPLGVGGTRIGPVVSPDTHVTTDPIWRRRWHNGD